MEVVNLLEISERAQLRAWLEANHDTARQCWVVKYVKHKPAWDAIAYIDIVEEALCFGWIDSTSKKLPDGCFVSMGNPLYVIFVDDIDAVDVASCGARLEHHPRFPQRCNIV
ncbi:MAG: hypothetical protein IIZ89_05990, partial [Muribaculaceae bacterium]|nr:hypothetical protein [Muribaculaceae bacterium]